MQEVSAPSASSSGPGRAPQRVLVLYEPGRAGDAAVDVARALAEEHLANLTIASVVPQAVSGARCGGSAVDYNRAVRESVAKELDQARRRLGMLAGRAAFKLLIEGADPPLASWSAGLRFDLILLPARRRLLRARRHPAAAALRRTHAEVRIVGASAG